MSVRIVVGDALAVLRTLPDESVQCVVTSPPYYGLRDYGVDGQIGLEPTPSEFIARLVDVFREVRRVLRADGTAWVNMGDSYAGSRGGQQGVSGQCADRSAAKQNCRVRNADRLPEGFKPKDLIGIPWRLAFALQADGWYLRQDIIWHKPNPMPESVRDRCTKAHEYVFLLSKSERYYYDQGAIKEPAAYTRLDGQDDGGQRSKRDGFKRDGSKRAEAFPGQSVGTHRADRKESAYDVTMRNKRSVWTISTKPSAEEHFATMAPELAETCILAGCPSGGTVLDPFGGAGTTGLVADRLGRDALLIELNPRYAEMARRRITADAPLFAGAA